MEKKEIEYNEEVYKKLFELVGSPDEGKKISQSAAAKAIGYSSAVVSAYKNRTYAGDVKKFEEAVNGWLKREARRVARVDVPTTETAAMDSIRKAVMMAQDDRDIAVITGDSGTGKTTALRAYAAENHGAILIEVDSDFTKNVLITEIAGALGVETKGSVTAVIARVVEALRGRDTVVIIDEADYLSDGSLELMRQVINDKAETGVVLCGLPRLKYKLENRRNDHEQLTGRVGVLLEVKRLGKFDAAKIIESVWRDLGKETVDAFIKTAGGSARTLVKLIRRVHQTMPLNRIETPDTEVIAAAGDMLMR
ncbi:MAG: AAA family ATPase [Spirochaetaceae bacterium]|jgi:DNA transposition AAA+ family ATPase|nr:AAA family ATPase [Spirochaetaceae bacterium]